LAVALLYALAASPRKKDLCLFENRPFILPYIVGRSVGSSATAPLKLQAPPEAVKNFLDKFVIFLRKKIGSVGA